MRNSSILEKPPVSVLRDCALATSRKRSSSGSTSSIAFVEKSTPINAWRQPPSVKLSSFSLSRAKIWLRVGGSGLRVEGYELRVERKGEREKGKGFRVSGSGFRM